MTTALIDKKSSGRWPKGARAAVCLTLDNLGEAADLNRNLWPKDVPVGNHYTVRDVLPKQILPLLQKYDIPITYFCESWNINIYGDFILNHIVGAGHEIAWHAWQHEAWSKLKDEQEERGNFERSFGEDGIAPWVRDGKVERYRGFRPPGGLINERTMKMCREFGLGYLSPAAEKAALVDVEGGDTLAVLPFKWAAVDAYFYMETFAGLRKMKGEYPEEPQSPDTLVQRYIKEIDRAIEEGSFLAPLFHPFLTNRPERVEAMETVLKYLVQKRDEGFVWLTQCKEVESYVREHPDIVGTDPEWDLSSWR